MILLAKILLYTTLFGSLGTLALAVDPQWLNMPTGHKWIVGTLLVAFASFAVYSVRLSFAGRSIDSLKAFAAAAAVLFAGLAWFYAPSVVGDRHLHQVVQAEIRCDGVSSEPLNRQDEGGLHFIESVCAAAEIARIRWNVTSSRSADENQGAKNGILFMALLAGCWLGIALMPSHVLSSALQE